MGPRDPNDLAHFFTRSWGIKRQHPNVCIYIYIYISVYIYVCIDICVRVSGRHAAGAQSAAANWRSGDWIALEIRPDDTIHRGNDLYIEKEMFCAMHGVT